MECVSPRRAWKNDTSGRRNSNPPTSTHQANPRLAPEPATNMKSGVCIGYPVTLSKRIVSHQIPKHIEFRVKRPQLGQLQSGARVLR